MNIPSASSQQMPYNGPSKFILLKNKLANTGQRCCIQQYVTGGLPI